VIDAALIVARALHFGATPQLQGCIVFAVLVACHLLREDSGGDAAFDRFLLRTIAAAWIVAVLSGAAWFLLLAVEIADSSVTGALSDGTAWTLLTQTQFGWSWIARAIGFALLAVCLAGRARTRRHPPMSALIAIMALALTGSLAWSGHGAATPGSRGNLHLASDILHLIASGVWLGGLLPFAILLRSQPHSAAAITRRFSSLATISVLILLPTGIVNGWMIVGSVDALFATPYGQLLLAKIALFLLMLAFAAVNRFVLAPRLREASLSEAARTRLIIHSGCELALGLAIVVLVGVLGTLAPQQHSHAMAGHDPKPIEKVEHAWAAASLLTQEE
jgi:putative copper resistance protein D